MVMKPGKHQRKMLIFMLEGPGPCTAFWSTFINRYVINIFLSISSLVRSKQLLCFVTVVFCARSRPVRNREICNLVQPREGHVIYKLGPRSREVAETYFLCLSVHLFDVTKRSIKSGRDLTWWFHIWCTRRKRSPQARKENKDILCLINGLR